MKYFLLGLNLLFLSTISAFSQSNVSSFEHVNNRLPAHIQDMAKPYDRYRHTGSEEVNPAQIDNNQLKAAPASSLNGLTVGNTTYDLQTNASIQQRIQEYPNGQVAVAFTYSNASNLTASDRGTGYNIMGANGWGASPTARIESERVGWPSIYRTGNGTEGIIAHNTVQGVLTQNDRSPAGSGAWNETLQMTATSPGLIWNRMAVGGPSDNTLHLIAVTAPVANGGSLYQGLDGALVYFRSTDGGATWGTTYQILPGMTSADYPSFDGDSYAIMARGNTVAIAVFNDFNESFIMKSTDNGLTWTKTVFWETGLTNYEPTALNQISDVDGDGISDTIVSTDGSGSVLIDNSDNVHVFFGTMRYLDDDPTTGTTSGSSFFPGTDGLRYWNETQNHDPLIIAGMEDVNSNGIMDFIQGDPIAVYYVSLTSFPSSGIAANGDLYVTYSSVMENLNNGNQHYRHVYVKKSTDGGCTWNEGIDVTGANDFAECVFASMYPFISDSIRIVFQEDFEPGLAVRGDEDLFTSNTLVYKGVDLGSIPSTPEYCNSELIVDGDPVFCPGDSLKLEATTCGSSFSWNTGQTSNVIYATAYQNYSVDITTACGVVNKNVDVAAPTGSLPAFTATTSKTEICPGDTASLSAPTVSGAAYLWSTGSTAQDITVNAPGTYTVTIANCQGSNNASVTIAQPTSVTATISNVDTEICPGQTLDLAVLEVTGGSYLWSTGATSLTTTITTAGTYTVTVSNCGGTDTESIVITTKSGADFQVQADGALTLCEGENLTLSATGGQNWIWYKDNTQIPGANTQSLGIQNVDQSGQYYVEADNQCGDRSNSDTVDVVVNPKPDVPALTVNGLVVTASSSGAVSYNWFVNGNPNSETSSTLSVESGLGTIVQVNASAVSAEGCVSDLSAAEAVESPSSVNELAGNSISIYPNPSTGVFRIEKETQDNTEFTIVNSLGKVVVKGNTSTLTTTVDLSEFGNGLYFLTLSERNAVATIKLIVK